jgi:hypothetical protein
MRNTILIWTGLFLLASAPAAAFDDGDFQVWNTEVEEFSVSQERKIALEQEFRWGDNAKDFYYQHYDIGFFQKLKKYLSIGAGYRQVYELKKGKFKAEEEPYLAASLLYASEYQRARGLVRCQYPGDKAKDSFLVIVEGQCPIIPLTAPYLYYIINRV